MHSLFRSRESEPPPEAEAATNDFPKIDGAAIAANTYGPRIAGDFYDSFRVGPQRIIFGLIDVSGRREHQQDVLTAAQVMFRSSGMELFSKGDFNEAEAMTELCLRLNRGLTEAAGGSVSCPAFMGCYHETFGTLCYTNAGHVPGLLRDQAGVSELPPTGLPLGLFSHATGDAPIIAIEPGAVLLLASRGVVEGKCKNDRAEDIEFGLDGVKKYLEEQASLNPGELSASILKTVSQASCKPIAPGEMTALAFMRNP